MEALEAKHRGWTPQIPKPVGMVIYNFLKEVGINEDKEWYLNFYKQILHNDWFPRTLQTHAVLFYYVKALRAGMVELPDNTPAAHSKAMTEFFLLEKKTKVGTYTYRDLLYMHLEDGYDYLDIDDSSPKNFSYLLRKKAAKRRYNHNNNAQLTLL